MLGKFEEHLTFANVMASLAVFCVLGGGVALAAGLKKNSVGKKQLKMNAVVTKKIADGAVKTNKLAEGAVTGGKADEASFGTVPSATSADTADSATSATNAENAQNAVNAQNATNATNAQDALSAQTLNGFDVSQVRGFGAGAATGGDFTLDTTLQPVPGMSTTVTVPAGGGDVISNASVGLRTTSVTASTGSCLLQTGTPAFGSSGVTMTVDTPALDDYNASISMSGFEGHVLPGGGTATVRVICQANIGDLVFDEGDLNVAVIGDG